MFRGAAAPVLGYGALNSILFVTYNRTLKSLDPSIFDYTKLAGVDLHKIWLAGAVGGLASWIVSAPSELIKCRAQLYVDGHGSSYEVAKDIWRQKGIRGFYLGGIVTSLRDSIGYAWYFWSYELTKRLLLSRQHNPFLEASTMEVLIAGGIAGVITWMSIYPLDVIKTRMQTRSGPFAEHHHLLQPATAATRFRPNALDVARNIYQSEGISAFYRGLGVCSLRAFIVNAVQVSHRGVFPATFADRVVVRVREVHGLVRRDMRASKYHCRYRLQQDRFKAI